MSRSKYSCTLLLACFTLLLGACSKVVKVENTAALSQSPGQEYSLSTVSRSRPDDGTTILLSFSGGGTRAAALAYGVLQELHATPADPVSGMQTLLEQVDTISAVSGGSFTAGYYGINGSKIFDDFESTFLRKNLQKSLISLLLTPTRWFESLDRTDAAVKLYDSQVFKGATFAQMIGPGKPLIIINSSDLASGVRFSFIEEYFSLLCSNLRDFSVARAVAASSAVPLLFHPVVLKNHDECTTKSPMWLAQMQRDENHAGSAEHELVVRGLSSYADKDSKRFVHLVDGGITDNLGLRALYDIVEISGGVKALHKDLHTRPPTRFAIISVDASTNTSLMMDRSPVKPPLSTTLSAISNVQLHRYNTTTIELIERSLKQWAEELSTDTQVVQPYFIRLSLQNTPPELHDKLNAIPTSFSIENEQVDLLIKTGRDLIRENPAFKALLASMSSSEASENQNVSQ